MAKVTKKSAVGTSFHNTTILCTPNELKHYLGEPTYDDNCGDDKVNLEWVCEDKLGNVFTIYDWKEYRPLSWDEKVNWHIGGNNFRITENAKKELEELFGRDLTDEVQENFYKELHSGNLKSFDDFISYVSNMKSPNLR